MNVTSHTRTTCPYCGVGCGVMVTHDKKNGITISGDRQHPANAGKLCSKGFALAETLNDNNRLTHPSIDGHQVSWDEATTHIASSFQKTIDTHGRDSVAFYVSGQLLTEDYYVVNKFVKGWLGTANIDTNSRLCMASSVTGHKRAFGSDTVPGCYEDLEKADLIILVGSNLAWCHPVIYQRIMETKKQRPELFIVVIDPRRSITADNADLHLAIQPDGDTLLFNALLHHLFTHGAIDQSYVDDHVSGFDETVAQAGVVAGVDVAAQLGITAESLNLFFKKVAATARTVTVYSQGVNQSASGTDKVNAIINTHLATGRMGKPGMGPFSITGQPNAMGGREVGGLATMLACHRDLDKAEHRSQVQRFWRSPHIADRPGLTAVDLFKAVNEGSIKAIWIMATNPVDSMPEADIVAQALTRCPLVIVSDVASKSDTLKYANVCLPAQAFGEKDGTVTNSERSISRQRRFIKPAGETRPDWWAMAQVAQKMGYGRAFNYASPAEIFSEYAQLSAFENNACIDFDIGALAELSEEQYDELQPAQWPRPRVKPAGNTDTEITTNTVTTLNTDKNRKIIRFFANGDFYTPDKRGRMIPIASASPGNTQLCDEYPLILNTGRIRDQWHTMTRTGYIPRLNVHRAEPFLELNPTDALIYGIEDADIVRVKSRTGNVLVRALLSDRQRSGHVFMPMHWSDQFASCARVDTLVQAKTDPHSRQPASKNQCVGLQRLDAKSYAYMLTLEEPSLRTTPAIEYWATSPVNGGWRAEAASTLNTQELVSNMLQANYGTRLLQEIPFQVVEFEYRTARRFAWFNEHNHLQSLLYVASTPVELSRSWASAQLQENFDTVAKRWQLMAGRTANDQLDKGAIVCSCFGVGDTEMIRAISAGICNSTEAIGKKFSAGTNCGSCRNEIDVLVRQYYKRPSALSVS